MTPEPLKIPADIYKSLDPLDRALAQALEKKGKVEIIPDKSEVKPS